MTYIDNKTHKKTEGNIIYHIYDAGDHDERAVKLAEYLLEKRATVRRAAREFGVSKSTVHKDVTVRLKRVDRALYEKTAELLETNKRERHLRGGMATRMKYLATKKTGDNARSMV